VQLSDIVTLVVRHGTERYAEKHAGVLLPLAVGAMLPGIAHKAIERMHSSEKMLNDAEDTKLGADMSWAGRPSGGSGGMLDFRKLDPSKIQFGPKPGSFAGTMQDIAGAGMGKAFGGQAAHGLSDSVKGVAASPLQGVAQGISGGIGESIKRMMLGREFGERKDPLHMGGSAAIQTFGKGVGEMGIELLRDMASKAMAAVGHAGDEGAREAILGDLKRNDPVLSSANDKVLMEAYHTMTRFAPTLSTDKNAVRSFLRQAVMSGSGPDYMSIKLLADSERSVTGGGKD